MKRKLDSTIFEKPWLILCEGDADRVCLNLVISSMAGCLDKKLTVRFPDRGDDGIGGRSKFGPYIDNLVEISPTFRSNVKAILILTDSDDDSNKSFAEVIASLSTSNKVAKPKAPEQWGRLPGQAHIYIGLIPRNKPGRLEEMCLSAAYKKWPVKQAVEDFAKATGAADWSSAKLQKMKVHAIIASTCEVNPEASLAQHWREKDVFHIPTSDQAFEDIRAIIKEFTSEAPI